ncbi:MAG: peptidylprolyl isomerase [Calditrichaeota bacterium]|nr:peptidylprolyl isomerase [Calditrichota bacterium]
MQKELRFLLPLFLVFGFLSSCDRSPDIVARVGDEIISTEEFSNALKQRYPHKNLEETAIEERRSLIKNMMEKKVKYMRAAELGMEQNADFLETIRLRESRLISSKLPEKLIVDSLVTEDMINSRLALSKARTDVILVGLAYHGVPGRIIHRSQEEAMTIAKEILMQVKQGEDLARLAEIYSDDSRVRNNQGLFSPYHPGTFHHAVDAAVFLTPAGELFGPVITPQGIFLGKVLEKESINLDTVSHNEKLKTKWNIYNNNFYQRGDSIYRELTANFKEELGWEVSSTGISQFLGAIDEWSRNPEANDATFTAQQRSIYLGRVGKDTITSGYFIDEFQRTFHDNYRKFNSEAGLEKMINELIQYQTWVIKAREHNIRELPEIRERMSDIRKNLLVEFFDREEIKARSIPTQEEIETYYQENKSNYMDSRRIHIREIAVGDSLTAEKILDKARKDPENFHKLAAEYTEKSFMKERGGDLGYQSVNSPRLVVQKAVEAGENQIIGPIHDRSYYYIIKTGDIEPERQKELSEVEIVVRSNVQQNKQEEILENHIAEFRKNHTYWINENVIKKLK